jgi:hypothetical protein
MKVIMSLALMVVCFSFAFAGTASAHTSTPARATNGPPVVIENVICCGESGVALKILHLFPGTSGSITNAYTISNSFSANVTVSAKFVSATLGFNVSQSYTLTANCSVSNTTHQIQNLNYYADYTTYDYEIWQAGHQIGVGSAEEYNSDECVYSGSTIVGPGTMP